jgi:hypothetical protein
MKSRGLPKDAFDGLADDWDFRADQGCDLDFLVGAGGSTVERESH